MNNQYISGGGVSSAQGVRLSGNSDAPKGPPQGFVDDARDSLDGAVSDLNILVVDLRGFADGMLGEVPPTSTPATNTVGSERISTSRAERLGDRLAWLHTAVADLRQQVNRLNAI